MINSRTIMLSVSIRFLEEPTIKLLEKNQLQIGSVNEGFAGSL
jgi:hypothetical protein